MQVAEASLVDGFPAQWGGHLLLCKQDNVNTDVIYPGKYTYQPLSPEEEANVVMENYDAAFQDLMQVGDVVIGGFNFGTGSSREQAATALKHRGCKLLIAGSFSETFKRNAINNGLLVLELPELV